MMIRRFRIPHFARLPKTNLHITPKCKNNDFIEHVELKYIVVEKQIIVSDEKTNQDLKDVKSRVTIINILLNNIIEDIDKLKRQLDQTI